MYSKQNSVTDVYVSFVSTQISINLVNCFSKYLAPGKLHRPNLREDIFTPFHFQISGLDLMHGWVVKRKTQGKGKKEGGEEGGRRQMVILIMHENNANESR